jgi:hypothetical protein
MKLQELSAPKPTKQISKVFESYFGKGIRFENLSAGQANKLLGRVRGLLSETRRQPDIHFSERNPTYLKLVMMEQALAAKLAEEMPVATAPGVTNPGAAAAATAAGVVATQKDPKVKAALQKAAKGQSLNPEEQKIVSGVALSKTESKLRRAYRMLKESEVQQAQVVLAAQDMVDKMQSMLEDTTELQFKELPALVDSIKNQVGIDQAQQFNTDVTAALSGLVQNLQAAKQQLDQALGVVTGQAAPGIPGVSAAPGADLGAEVGADIGAAAGGAPGAEAGAELGAEAGADLAAADFGDDAEAAPAAALGRKRR